MRKEIDSTEIFCIVLFEDIDVKKDKKADSILKQLSPSQKPAFVGHIKTFRKERDINIKKFLSFSKKFKFTQDRYFKKCKGKFNIY